MFFVGGVSGGKFCKYMRLKTQISAINCCRKGIKTDNKFTEKSKVTQKKKPIQLAYTEL